MKFSIYMYIYMLLVCLFACPVLTTAQVEQLKVENDSIEDMICVLKDKA